MFYNKIIIIIIQLILIKNKIMKKIQLINFKKHKKNKKPHLKKIIDKKNKMQVFLQKKALPTQLLYHLLKKPYNYKIIKKILVKNKKNIIKKLSKEIIFLNKVP